jgi:hypothetical protein
MKRHISSILLVVLAAAVMAGGQAGVDPEKISARLDAMRQSGALIKWQEVPWLLDLKEGMRQSREEKRPLFLWVAGDDPLERC